MRDERTPKDVCGEAIHPHTVSEIFAVLHVELKFSVNKKCHNKLYTCSCRMYTVLLVNLLLIGKN